jgi:lipopolysaccharide/colanic/teichoic acid biosynthesis glycosyltransferase
MGASSTRTRDAARHNGLPGTVPDLMERLDERTLEILDHRRRTSSIRRRGWLVRRMLLLGDALGLALAFVLSYAVLTVSGRLETAAVVPFAMFAATLPGWTVLAKIYGLYERDEERTDHTTADDLVGVFHLVTVGTWLFFVASQFTDLADPNFQQLITFWVLAIVFITLGRVAARGYCRRQLTYLQNTVVVGAGDVGQEVARKLMKRPEYGINLVGFVDADPRDMSPDLNHLTMLGRPADLPAIVRLFDIERVVVAFTQDSYVDELALIRTLTDLEVQVDIVPRLFEIVGPSVDIHTVEGLPLVGLPPLRLSRSSLMLKRSMDVTVAALGLLLLLPVFAAIAVAIRFDSRGPVFYRGERIGRNGRRFRLLKFRTMRIEHCRGDSYGGDRAEAEFERLMDDPAVREEFHRTHKLSADPRVTRVGAFLRRTSLDELPQLLNVIGGDIAVVGPRPITVDEHELLRGNREENVVHLRGDESPDDVVPSGYQVAGYWEVEDLRPGITGYWQITGRSDIGYDERVRLDMAYVKSWSLKLDLMILSKTLRALTSSRGAY